MKVKRLVEHQPLERLILIELWSMVRGYPKDGVMRTFNGSLQYRDEMYGVECDFMLVNEFLRVYKLNVMHKDKLIITQDKIRMGAPIYKEIYLPTPEHLH